MNTTASELKQYCLQNGADLVAIAGIDRFADLPPEKHPHAILPEARSVIVLGKRIARGMVRAIEEGAESTTYRHYGFAFLEDYFLAPVVYALCRQLEDQGWEACPLPDMPPEIPAMGVPVRDDMPAPNVMLDIRDAAVRAGMGEIGWCDILLTPRFGPLQRIQAVITDAELEADPSPCPPVCDQCREGEKWCPLGAFDGEADINTGGKSVKIAQLKRNKCNGCGNGAIRNRHDGRGRPDRIGAICIRSCLDHLEKTGRIEKKFNTPLRTREPWRLDAEGVPL